MRKLMPVAALAVLTVIAAYTGLFKIAVAQNAAEAQYEAMNPWADVDPFPPKAIAPRLSSLDGKKIGLFANSKRSSVPQARMVEKYLKEKFPTIQADLFHAPDPSAIAKDSPDYERLTAWVKNVDAVVLTVCD